MQDQLVGKWRGVEDARDEMGPYQVEANFDFAADGTITADMEFPDPLGHQLCWGMFRFTAPNVLEVSFGRWHDGPRTYTVTIRGDQMTWSRAQETKTFQRLR
jgi:hypothetical protein